MSEPHSTLMLAKPGPTYLTSPIPLPSDTAWSFLEGVTAVSSDDVWAVGYLNPAWIGPLIEHWDGTSWTLVRPEVALANVLYAVDAISANVGRGCLCR